MEVQAPKGQYRVIGLDPIDTLTSPNGPLWKDCETLTKHETWLTGMETCTSGSTCTTTPARFCTSEAVTSSSLKRFKS